MKKDNRFGGVIWTDHALDRIQERGIPKDYAISTFKSPDITENNNGKGVRLTKKIEDKTITLVITKNERSEPLAVSIWMDPPMVGTEDHRKKMRYNEYKKGSVGKKIWLIILKQLGL